MQFHQQLQGWAIWPGWRNCCLAGGRTTLGGGAATSGGQNFALTFLIPESVGFAVYAAMLYSQMTKGAKADLSRQGGAMA